MSEGASTMLRAWVLLIALCGSANSLADTLKSEGDLRSFCDRVMGSLAKGGTSAAFAEMKPYAIISGAEFDSMTLSSKAQREQFGARYGKTLGFEFIRQKKAGESLVLLTYVEKTEKHALPWLFYFYKTPSGWMLNSFQWNDQMPKLFSQE
jgi:hypothetical protein